MGRPDEGFYFEFHGPDLARILDLALNIRFDLISLTLFWWKK